MLSSPMGFRRRAYFTVIGLTLLLVFGNQVFIQYWLYQKSHDAEIINLAGRQRMLSQKIALLLVVEDRGLANASEELWEVESQWRRTHNQFLDPESRLSLHREPAVLAQVKALTPYIEFTRAWIAEADPLAKGTVVDLIRNQSDFLAGMSKVVFEMEAVSEAKLWFISRAEIVLMVLTLAVFFIEVLWITRPYVRKIRGQRNRLEEVMWYQSHMVRSPNARIQGLLELVRKGDISEV